MVDDGIWWHLVAFDRISGSVRKINISTLVVSVLSLLLRLASVQPRTSTFLLVSLLFLFSFFFSTCEGYTRTPIPCHWVVQYVSIKPYPNHYDVVLISVHTVQTTLSFSRRIQLRDCAATGPRLVAPLPKWQMGGLKRKARIHWVPFLSITSQDYWIGMQAASER